MKNIAVIFGGESCEHDISIITGEQLISKFDELLYNIIPIYIDKLGIWKTGKDLKDIDDFANGIKKSCHCAFIPGDQNLYIKRSNKFKKFIKIDMAFICLHGLRGEDGSVASILELCKIPYSSSSILASSLCMDKSVFKILLKGFNVNFVSGFSITEKDFSEDSSGCNIELENLGFPVILKPSRQGSSIGIQICKNADEFNKKLKSAFIYDKKVLIEKFIDVKKEVNIAIFNNKSEYILSSTEEPVSSDEILSFDNKYRKNSGGFETIKRIVPANISLEIENYIKETALKLYKELEMFGVVRFDFIIDKNDDVFVNEVNTIPGSLANYLFDKNKYDYKKIIELIISNATLRLNKSNEVERVFDTDVLENDFDGFKK